uniref:Uncharacterized protein n=1 Tax=Pavo cristatus TaxID=9049 RepID=A0A8C9ESS3_PAVCR
MSEDTLLHGEALFVIATTDPDNIALISRNLCGHSLLIECSQLPVAGKEMLTARPPSRNTRNPPSSSPQRRPEPATAAHLVPSAAPEAALGSYGAREPSPPAALP